MSMTQNPDFTLARYADCLREAAARGYAMVPVRKALRSLADASAPTMVLRHDVDFSMDAALHMAEVEQECGVCATYYILLHSPSYNVGDPDTAEQTRRLHQLGHEVGLHYDLSFFERLEIDAMTGIKAEAAFLSSLTGQPVNSVAQHMPATQGNFGGVGEQFVDAYDPRLSREIGYISDSRRTWRWGTLVERISTDRPFQVLIHPEWWPAGDPVERRPRIEAIAALRNAAVENTLAEYLDAMERKDAADAGA